MSVQLLILDVLDTENTISKRQDGSNYPSCTLTGAGFQFFRVPVSPGVIVPDHFEGRVFLSVSVRDASFRSSDGGSYFRKVALPDRVVRFDALRPVSQDIPDFESLGFSSSLPDANEVNKRK